MARSEDGDAIRMDLVDFRLLPLKKMLMSLMEGPLHRNVLSDEEHRFMYRINESHLAVFCILDI